MTEPDVPQPRFPFLTRALSDADAAERLGRILSEGGRPGESEEELLERVRDELEELGDRLLRRLNPGLRQRFEPRVLVKEFLYGRIRVFEAGVPDMTKGGFLAIATARMLGIIKDHLRRKKHEQKHLQSLAHRVSPSAGSEAADDELLAMALDAVDRLEPRTRQVFNLKLNGLTYREIEEKTGMPTSTAQRLCERAQAMIEDEIARLGGIEDD